MKQESWSNILGFLIATIAMAVGLGNYWRMPYLASQYGYVSFFIAFLACVFFVAIPIMFVELVAGKIFKLSFIEVYKKMKFPYPAYIAFFLIVILASFYVVVAGWVFSYVFTYPFYTLTFQELIETDIAPLGYIFVLIIASIPVYSGIREGIEKFSKIFMSILFLITLLIFFVILTENPIPEITLSFPTSLELWLLAFSQAFFSLSVGFGVMFTYATYIKQKTSIFVDSLIIGFSDALVGLVASFMIFVLLDGMINTEGPVLVFDVLSSVFKNQIIGWSFYLCLTIAAITSIMSLLEFIVSNLKEYGLERKKAIIITVIILLILSLPSALSYSSVSLKLFNIPILDLLNEYVIGATSWLGIFFITFFIWKIDEKKFSSQLGAGKLNKLIYYWCKYIIPIFGIIMFYASIKFLFGW